MSVEAWRSAERRVVPGPHTTRWLGVRYLEAGPGIHTVDEPTPESEAAVVLVQGEVAEVARGGSRFALGPRPSPFDDPPQAAYLPAGGAIELRLGAPAAVAVAWAAGGGPAAYRVGPDGVAVERRGVGVTERTVRHLLAGDRPARSLWLVEVITPPGHWSSFPPHRHDQHRPPEAYAMEEAYLFRVDPPSHRALMGTWRDGPDAEPAAFAVADGDLVMVRSGYHTVSAAPGSRLYYLNAAFR
jgi:5-deoxy-glucuronate isomerase